MFTMINFSYVLMSLLGFLGLFLIGLILLQRGRGGGLAGAFGGMGGQSAFGTKAGDVFTRITIGVASAWILLCAGSVLALHFTNGTRYTGGAEHEPKVEIEKAKPKDDEKSEVAPADLKAKPPVNQPKKDDADKPAATEDKKADDKKAEDKKADEKPAEAAPVGDKPKDEPKPKEDPKPDAAKPAEDAKPKEDGQGDKKPADPKPAEDAKPEVKPESKPEPKAE